MNSNLYIVGTIHTDLLGPQRLEKFLESVQPAHVLAEAHENRLKLYEEELKKDRETKVYTIIDRIYHDYGILMKDEQMENLQLIYNRFLESYNFEYSASKKYTEENKVNFTLMDLPVINSIHDGNFMNELLLSENSEKNDKKAIKTVLDVLGKNPELFVQYINQETQERYETSITECSKINSRINLLRKIRKWVPRFFLADWADKIDVILNICDPRRDQYMAQCIRTVFEAEKPKTVAVCGLYHMYRLEDLLQDLHPTTTPLNRAEELTQTLPHL
ncbi:hypothetical protein J4456_00385 [Candidatus Pacearchaeota archaeon]|nr:hypothetical protein [Candidatus Pacearchaeota archaeon]